MKVKLVGLILMVLLTPRKDARSQWAEVIDPGGSEVLCLTSYGGKLFAGAWQAFPGTEGGVFSSTNDGLDWIAGNSGLTNRRVTTFATNGDNIFVGDVVDTIPNGILFRSTNGGKSWNDVTNGLDSISDIYAMAVCGGNLFVGVSDVGISKTSPLVFLSTDNGSSWNNVSGDLYSLSGNSWVWAIAANGERLFVGIAEAGVYLSSDSGGTWHSSSSGLPLNANVGCFAFSGGYVFAGLDSIGLPYSTGSGVYRSSDSGATWAATNNGLVNAVIRGFAVYEGNIFAATANGVFLSTNNGESWRLVNGETSPIQNVRCITIHDGYLFAAVYYNHLWRFPLSDLNLSSVQPEPKLSLSVLRVFPNPASGKITIVSASGPVTLMDPLGRSYSVPARGTKLDVSSLPPGVYFVSDGVSRTKFVKE